MMRGAREPSSRSSGAVLAKARGQAVLGWKTAQIRITSIAQSVLAKSHF